MIKCIYKEGLEKDLLPRRKTKYSAGYDLIAHDDLVVKANSVLEVPLPITLAEEFEEGDLPIYSRYTILPRSSLAIKKRLTFDGFEPYMFSTQETSFAIIGLKNLSNEDIKISKGEAYAQLVILGDDFVKSNEREGIYKSISQIKDIVVDDEFFQFQLSQDAELKAGTCTLLPTDIKAKLEGDEFLMLELAEAVSSPSTLMMSNIKGVVDSDYYDNPDNSGHIMFPVFNFGYVDTKLPKGTRLGYGTILKYKLIDKFVEEESEVEEVIEETDATREGGFGSTDA